MTLRDLNDNFHESTNENLNFNLALYASQFINPATGQPISARAVKFSFSFGPDFGGNADRAIVLNFTSAIPEPTLALLGLAAVAFVARRR